MHRIRKANLQYSNSSFTVNFDERSSVIIDGFHIFLYWQVDSGFTFLDHPACVISIRMNGGLGILALFLQHYVSSPAEGVDCCYGQRGGDSMCGRWMEVAPMPRIFTLRRRLGRALPLQSVLTLSVPYIRLRNKPPGNRTMGELAWSWNVTLRVTIFSVESCTPSTQMRLQSLWN